ncbi:LapA family protein [Qipengyuania spongiae]|uniref:LapA family protein n=1 Tax=Qipengyuania spongiae TaxID=2909673 RepID=A0ABY5T002_9SPHN|nr:LapA family protein [Qipengyuania spongiae]UVI38656.1 LapA family protein [Qipengyuania spongiae]
MQILRTAFWILILVALLVFTAFNWKPVEVKLWENMIVETKVPALVILAFLLGLVPTWLLHRGTKWRLERRISQLESAARTTAASRAAPAGIAADPAVLAREDAAAAPVVEPAPVRPEPVAPAAPGPLDPARPVDPADPDHQGAPDTTDRV